MIPFFFQIHQLPDLKAQKYISLHGQGVRQKVLSNQKDFLLLLSDLAQIYQLTFSIRYFYEPNQPFDQQLKIYFVVSQSDTLSNSKQTVAKDIHQIINQGFLSQFYQIESIQQNIPPQLQSFDWVTYIGEALKYEEIINTKPKDTLENQNKKNLHHYYVPLQIEANEANDMLVVCQTITSFKSTLMLEITLQPDTSSLEEKSKWINALDQMLSQLRQASSGSNLTSNRDGDRNAQLVARIYEKFQSSYLTESLYHYSFKVLGQNDLAVRSVLGTLMLSGTKNSRYRTIMLTSEQSAFKTSLAATQQGKISTVAEWQEWKCGLGEAEFGGDSLTGKGSVQVADLKPLHRYATLNEISGLFRIVVPSDAPVIGINQENDITSLGKDKKGIDFGGYETTRPENTIQIDLEQLNKHTFICGVPGSGKTTTAFNLLTQLWCQDIPFLVFEPAKTEYRSLLAINPDSKRFTSQQLKKLYTLTQELRVYTLGNDLISPFRFNPFVVSAGVPFFEHIANLEACFRGALPLSGPLPALLSEALEEIYYDRGWTGGEGGTPQHLQDKIPTMRDLYSKITALFETKDYAGEVKSNLKTALEVRIGSLLRRGVGAMLNTQQSYPNIADLLKYPTVLELDYLNQDQANLMTFFLLTKIREYIKTNRPEKPGVPEHIILLEEAHNVVGRNLGASSAEDANTKQEAANYIIRMLAEMRALREAIIIADQLPTTVAAEVVKNTNVKIAHRLVSADDRKDVGQTMLLDSAQTEEIARLNPGESFLYMEGWYRPHAVKIPYENSAKVKLRVESSIPNNKVKDLIQIQPWYREGQEMLISSAIAEHERFCNEYSQSLDRIRTQFKQVNVDCTKLNGLLGELIAEVFHHVAGEMRFHLDPLPTDELQLQLALIRLTKVSIPNLGILRPSPHLSLINLLELRSYLFIKIDKFEQNYQEAVSDYNRIPYNKYKQQWQQLNRNLQTIQQQVDNISKSLSHPAVRLTTLQSFSNQFAYQQRLIEESEYLQIKDVLEALKKNQQKLKLKLKEVFEQWIEWAKANKAEQDLQ